MSDVKGHDTSYEWKIILLLSITFGLVGLDRFVLPIILQSPNSTMAADLGLTPQDGGTLAGYLGMAWGISAFVMGYLADKVGRREVLVPAIVVFSLMSAFSGMAGSVMGLVHFPRRSWAWPKGRSPPPVWQSPSRLRSPRGAA